MNNSSKAVRVIGILVYIWFILPCLFTIGIIVAFSDVLFWVYIAFAIFLSYKYMKMVNKWGTTTNVSADGPGAVYFDQAFALSEDEILKLYIDEEIKKGNYDIKKVSVVKKRKMIFTVIFALLSFLIISLMFFHISNFIILLEVVNLVVYVRFMKKFNIYSYISKQIKARPDEDISNIVVSILSEQSNYSFGLVSFGLIAVSCCLPLFIFMKPMMFFEKAEDGYHLRFCTTGLIGNKELTVPSEYKGEPVTGIRGNVFANMTSLEKVNLPDSIVSIRGQAFKNAKNLISVDLPDNLTYLGGSAFKNCESLTSIVIPEGVTIIEGATFYGCSSLMTVVLPSGLTEIGGEAFEECTSLTSIVIPESVTRIGGEAFMNCSSLISVNLPNQITEVRGSTFEGCSSLTSIVIPEGVTRIGGSAFRYCSSLRNVTIPTSVREIGSSAFRECTSLGEVRVPKSAAVNERAFKDSYVNIIYVNDDGTEYGGSYGYGY